MENGKWKYTIPKFNPENFVRWTNGTMSCDGNVVREQFTGLLDKNGKEIYESDSVEFSFGLGIVKQIKCGEWCIEDTNGEGLFTFKNTHKEKPTKREKVKVVTTFLKSKIS